MVTCLLFGADETRNGVLFHQAPTRKQPEKPGNPELADWYVAKYKDGVVHDPVAVVDGKLNDIKAAMKTSL